MTRSLIPWTKGGDTFSLYPCDLKKSLKKFEDKRNNFINKRLNHKKKKDKKSKEEFSRYKFCVSSVVFIHHSNLLSKFYCVNNILLQKYKVLK